MPKTQTEEIQNDVIKLLLEKAIIATSRFIKGEIDEKQRESTYDEVYLGINQEIASSHTQLIQEIREKAQRNGLYVRAAYDENIKDFLDSLTSEKKGSNA